MYDINDSSLEARVARGIEFLDQTQPSWRDQISLGDLNLGSCNSCILGQVFQDQMSSWYGSGWNIGSEAVLEYMEIEQIPTSDEKGYLWDERAWLGFDRANWQDADYEQLQFEWEKQLKA